LSISIAEACMRCHRKATELNIEESIAECLKHAPNKPGGSRYRVSLKALTMFTGSKQWFDNCMKSTTIKTFKCFGQFVL
jgi:hypothetical protein